MSAKLVRDYLTEQYQDADWIVQASDGVESLIAQCIDRFHGRPAPRNYVGGTKQYAMPARTPEELRQELGIVDGKMTKPISPEGFAAEAPKEKPNERHDTGSVPWL